MRLLFLLGRVYYSETDPGRFFDLFCAMANHLEDVIEIT